MIKIIGYIAKRLCKKKYALLKDRLLFEQKQLTIGAEKNYETLSRVLISGEDHRFHYHIGFDIIAIIRAIRNKIIYGKIEGASTIEQQLVRVLTNDFEKTFRRKIQEIVLATTVTSIVPKNSIPKIYLNVAYYGTEMNGLKEATSKMGINELENIPIELAAELISRIKYPQPLKVNIKRQKQIETRKHHLVSLYNKHNSKKYFKIYG